MFSSIVRGFNIIGDSVKVFFRHPLLLIPLLITWCVFAPVILACDFFIDFESMSIPQVWIINITVLFIFTFCLSFSCAILLEMIEHIENNEEPDFIKALLDTLSFNLVRMVPLIFMWTIIWIILLFLQALFSPKKRRRSSSRQSFSAKNAAASLSGQNGRSGSLAYFFKLLQKKVRMVVFLILPAICWENKGFFSAIKRGLSVYKQNLVTFLSGFAMSETIAFIIFIPIAFLFGWSSKAETELPDIVWYVCILYTAMAWSYSIFIEQMFCADLFLWHKKWEKAVEIAEKNGQDPPNIEDIPMPSLLDEVPDLLEESGIHSKARNVIGDRK